MAALTTSAPDEKFHVSAILQRKKQCSTPELLLVFKEEPARENGVTLIGRIKHSNPYPEPNEPYSSSHQISVHVEKQDNPTSQTKAKCKYKVEAFLGTFPRVGRAVVEDHLPAIIGRLKNEGFLVRNPEAEMLSLQQIDRFAKELQDVFLMLGDMRGGAVLYLDFQGYEVPEFVGVN
ncbi:uncharacterized protein DSM5745_04496 [Aspergillus mulundensis]|uniref:Uncharacterized protein n=1 Tax=Aspergillus mulundensis TaxID=1810919 RepID=A0A3D8SCU7_9EURO|nr:hypothetical protein DSM5745_04496 [Aspergillus mulundensis]RDW84170.1 hypothetical protein DSM5745_04496 [Aspergillus mulundensis]